MPASQSLIAKIDAVRLATDMMAPGLVAMFESSKREAVASDDSARAFLEKATDVECLSVLSQVSLEAPLNDLGYKLMMHFAGNVFSAAGITNIPDFILDKNDLDSYHRMHLERFRVEVREKQLKQKKISSKHLVL